MPAACHYQQLDEQKRVPEPLLGRRGCCSAVTLLGAFAATMIALSRPSAVTSLPGMVVSARASKAPSGSVEAHQQGEVSSSVLALRALNRKIRSGVSARIVADDALVPPGCKKVHFIRHGEGYHNVAQREWRAASSWDGKSEPYTIDQDPTFRYADALLTPEGESQARALTARTRALAPQLLVVSPLRRATQTGLLAFAPHVAAGSLPTIAQELCHEMGGKHTCDRRLGKSQLAAQFPAVSYALLEAEDDPYWGDGLTRETPEHLARRGLRFASWLRARPETHVAVASHSAFLLALFNAVLQTEKDDEAVRAWFGTGEMRTVLLAWD